MKKKFKLKHYKRSSQIFESLFRDNELQGNITFRHILKLLEKRAFGIAMLIFALPSIIPLAVIPGVSLIFSVPIAVFAFQMIIARKNLWLPKFIANYSIPHKALEKIILKSLPTIKRIEKFLKPRWSFMLLRTSGVLIGIFIFCLAILLMLPIPFSNFFIAFLIILFSLGLAEKDGLVIVLSMLGSLIYFGFIYVFIFNAIKAIIHWS